MRKILGFAVLAIAAWFILKLFLSLFGMLIAFGITILTLAVIGMVIYAVLKVVAPSIADKIGGMISGKPRIPSDFDRV